MFNIIINDGKNKIPEDDGISYVIGKDGIFLRKKIGVTDSLTKVSQIGYLKEVKEFATVHLPKIPSIKFEKVVKFFQYIHNTLGTEVMVLMLLNNDENEISFITPVQVVTGATIDYKPISVEGYHLVGSIHSHSGMSAFHSGTDVSDECDFDGLHITLGSFGRKNGTFSLSAEVAINGFRQKANIHDYVDGLEEVIEKTVSYAHTTPGFVNNFGFGNYFPMHDVYNTPFFLSNTTKDKIKKSKTVKNIYFKMKELALPEDWIDLESVKKVSKKVYVPRKYPTYGKTAYGKVKTNTLYNPPTNQTFPIINEATKTPTNPSTDWETVEEESFLDEFEELQDMIDMFCATELPCSKCKHDKELLALIKNIVEYIEDNSFTAENSASETLGFEDIDYDSYNFMDEPSDVICKSQEKEDEVLDYIKGDNKTLLQEIKERAKFLINGGGR